MRRLVIPLAALLLVVLVLTGCSARKPVGPPTWEIQGPWEHLHVDVPDRVEGAPLRMHYLAAGDPTAPRVVLLHGFPDTSFGWRDVLPALATEHRVLAPDLRGYGGTDRPEGGYDIGTLAGDIAGFIAEVNAADGLPADTKVHLVTHDWGAATGWWVATVHGALLRSFTATSVPHPRAFEEFLAEDREQRRRATYQDQLAAPGVAGLLAGFTRRQLARLYRGDLQHPEHFTDEHLDAYSTTFRTADDWRTPLAYYVDLKRDLTGMRERVASAPKVQVPTLVLWGEHDGFLYARQAERSCAYVDARCEVEVFPDAGHFVQWDVPDSLLVRWRAFVSGL